MSLFLYLIHLTAIIIIIFFFFARTELHVDTLLVGFIIAVDIELWVRTQQSCMCTGVGWGVLDRETSLNPG